jgi:hypothetical protein
MPEPRGNLCPCGNPERHEPLCSLGASYYSAITGRRLSTQDESQTREELDSASGNLTTYEDITESGRERA